MQTNPVLKKKNQNKTEIGAKYLNIIPYCLTFKSNA